MFPNSHAHSRNRGRRSSALVITLAALVLVSTILVVFLGQSSLNRQISFSSAGQYRADLIAHSSLDTITGDLRTEIAAGSTVYTSNNVSIYIPTTNFTVVPYRVSDQGFPNLIKQSASGTAFWTGISYNAGVISPIRSASNNSTLTPSANGRFINIKRWNKAGLLGDPGSGTLPTIPNTYTTPPDWVLVTRQGAITNTATLPAIGPGTGALSDKSTGNENYVIGRYAYTIYDEGGLLDVNIAGYPSSVVGTDFTSKRGLLPQVDLGNIPGVLNANALVQWRNNTSAASATAYTNYVLSATNGFTTVAPGDQAFVSRKDLIRYVQANSSQVSTSALQYLGTFSSEANAPSYTPDPNRSKVQSSYATTGLDDQFNPSLINLRVTAPFVRDSDNTSAQIGDPLIKYRFALSRLGLVTRNATADSTSLIYKYFGLQRGSSTGAWTYNHGSAGQIYTLNEIVGREPDFFELLQAAISVGSLGVPLDNSFASVIGQDTNTYYQIIQIGANLIDQYNSGSWPTRIVFGSKTISGIKNLPYLMRVMETPYRKDNNNVGGWFEAVVWNPHAQPGTVTDSPTQFRYALTGAAYMSVSTNGGFPLDARTATSAVNTFDGSSGITFLSSNTYSSPTLLCTQSGASAPSADSIPASDATNGPLGIWVGDAPAVEGAQPWEYAGIFPSQTTFLTHNLQYWDGTQWVTYDSIENIDNQIGTQNHVTPDYTEYYSSTGGKGSLYPSDPRTDRFGAVGTANPFSQTIRTDVSNGELGWEWFPNPGNLFTWTLAAAPPSANSFYFGTLSDNLSTSANHYTDLDGIQRRADGAYVDGSLPDGGYPLATDAFNSTSSRPLMLNRPFRSVAEMGYASRGEPWKHLDFFTAESADAALLDLFCLNEPSHTQPEAGRVDLNTRQQPVLQALLQGAIKSDFDGTTISASEAMTLATSLTNLTTSSPAGPLLNRSQLVTRYAPLLSYSSTSDKIIKRRREAAIRALADIGQTRTWNLLIDVIAQSGRYNPTATTLDQFTVEGERRYWLHVAIDRYTGKIISQNLEAVYE